MIKGKCNFLKRVLVYVALLAVALSACGNSSTASAEKETDADGNWISRHKDFTTVYADKLPCNLPYNGSTLVVKDLRLYQGVNNFEHYLYAIADIDLSDLSDEDFHWIFKDDDLDYYIFISGSENELDSEMMSRVGYAQRYTDSKQLEVAWNLGTTKAYKHDFNGAEVKLTVSAEQEEENPIHVYYSIEPEEIPDISSINEDDEEFLNERLKEKIELYEKMYG